MSKNLGRTVFGLFLLKGAVLGGVYLYNKYAKEDSNFKEQLRKDFNDSKHKLSDVTKQAKEEVTALKDNVIEKAENVLESLREDKKKIKKEAQVTVKKVVRKAAVKKSPVVTAEKAVTVKKTARKSVAKKIPKTPE